MGAPIDDRRIASVDLLIPTDPETVFVICNAVAPASRLLTFTVVLWILIG